MAEAGTSRSRDWRAAVEDSVKRAELESFLFTGLEEAEGKFGKEVPETGEDVNTDSDNSEDGEPLIRPTLQLGDDEDKGGPGGIRERKAVWEDEDEAGLLIDANASRQGREMKKQQDAKVLTGTEYSNRLRAHHEKLHPHTSWAKMKGKTRKPKRQRVDYSSSEDDDRIDQVQGDADDIVDDLLVSANPLLGQNKSLQRGQINISTMPEANKNARTFGFVNSVQFQSTGQLMLSCGRDKRLHLFNIDGVENPNIQSVHFEDMKIWKAAFSQSDDQVIVSGIGKNHFYFFDVETGGLQRISSSQAEGCPNLSAFTVSSSKEMPLVAFYGHEGNLSLFSVNSRQWVGQLKMNSGAAVESAAISHDGRELYSAGSGGRIHVWDLRMRRCLHRFTDEGALRCTSMAIDQRGKYLATGSEMGVVNVYNFAECGSSNKMQPKPIKALTNLTTTIDLLEFNPDSQILAIGSQRIPSALRLVHLPSCTVFQNWPTQRTPLGNVSSAAFSPGGGFFAAGNSKGKVLLYRVHHYNNA